MPELPEVETVVRSLAPVIVGQRIQHAEFRQLRILKGEAQATVEAVTGQKIEGIKRHGKFIAIQLERGVLTVHLGMTGRLLIDPEPTKWTHALFTLEHNMLLFDDPRQFGRIEYGATLPERVAALGPEPLEVTLEEFTRRVRERKSPIKAVLLNQAVVRGVGNIYADELLHRAGVLPRRKAASLAKDRIRKIFDAMREVLSEAIAARGSSVSDYVDADGNKGDFQNSHRVYQRHGEPCTTCGMPVKRIILAQRGTHYCGVCQK